MGFSGAGKTTLLNVLTRRNRGDLQVQGHVFANDQPFGKSLISMSAYVQQDDLMFPNLTVNEHLAFQVNTLTSNMISNYMQYASVFIDYLLTDDIWLTV